MTEAVTDMAAITARLDRERDFHNSRFSGDILEEPRLKYYAALSDCDAAHNGAVAAAAAGADVLEYGCAEGEAAVALGGIARRVHGIDISEIAIAKARGRAKAAGAANVAFSVADAMATGLPDDSFDLVYGSGIIHHLDTERSLREIRRILRPGGVALFKEPLVGNFVLNIYRRATPDSRTPDEHPLTRADLKLASDIFATTRYRHYGLLTIGVVPLRRSRFARPLYRSLATLDALLFRVPGLRWQAWYVSMAMVK